MTVYTPVNPFAYQWPDSDTVEVFHPGMHFDETHPAIRTHRSCFVPVDDLPTHGQRFGSDQVVNTRKNPGEKR